MVRRIGKPISTAPVKTTAQAPKKSLLNELKAKMVTFMRKKGESLLGAGKPPTFSQQAPSKSSKRVSQAVERRVSQATGKSARIR